MAFRREADNIDNVSLLFINRSWAFVAGRQDDLRCNCFCTLQHVCPATSNIWNTWPNVTKTGTRMCHYIPYPPTTTIALIADAINTIQYPWRLKDFTKINFLDTGPQSDSMQQSSSSEYTTVGPQPVKKSPTFCGTMFIKPSTRPNHKLNQIQPTSNFSSFRTT